ncbi:MAG: M23 family metallopeptidase [Candidatus Symbiobacter sp.]|nr:M23 family metallopeptidase [Candidatus Symbiobacter sp.]
MNLRIVLLLGLAVIPPSCAAESVTVTESETSLNPMTLLPGRRDSLDPPYVALPNRVETAPAAQGLTAQGLAAPGVAAPGVAVLAGALVQGQVALPWRTRHPQLFFAGMPVKLSADGRFIFAIPRDATGDNASDLTLMTAGAKGTYDKETITFDIISRDWDIQRIDNLPQRLTNDVNAATVKKIAANAAKIRQARQRDTDGIGYRQEFIWPVLGRISGIFGSQRILAGVPHAFHAGIDIAAPMGSEICAPAAGIVSLVDHHMVLTGQTLMIDHGHGLSSVFAHLSKILVKPGQKIRQGQLIARIGMTGRATGPHVHWGIYWHDIAVDPGLLLPPLPTEPEVKYSCNPTKRRKN